jgi:hypothetical protein
MEGSRQWVHLDLREPVMLTVFTLRGPAALTQALEQVLGGRHWQLVGADAFHRPSRGDGIP